MPHRGGYRSREKRRDSSFEPPERAPGYEVLTEDAEERCGVRNMRLLVGTRAGERAGLELITRDLKARYSSYDTVSAEFTGASGTLDYTGSALIFNTPAGARYIGYVYYLPNDKGYVVNAAE